MVERGVRYPKEKKMVERKKKKILLYLYIKIEAFSFALVEFEKG